MDIIVTIPKSEYNNIALEDKFVEENKDVVQYWKLNSKPKNFNVGDKVYFVMNGNIIGFQECIGFENDANCDVTNRVWEGFNLVLKCPMTKLDKVIPMKGFQGYRYYKPISFIEHYNYD